ncbi:M55 family metallopeptidase [bacterium]|nr:M55 family metallopeptidase [bacterium]
MFREMGNRSAGNFCAIIWPSLLNKNAKLLCGRSSGPKNMMEAIDESFHTVVFIGYHAKAGTPDAILEHTTR